VTDPPASLQGHYAGAASRAAAYAVDAAVSTTAFSVGAAAATYLLRLIAGIDLDVDRGHAGWAVGYAAWLAVYYGYSWAATGRSAGSALLGLRITARDGGPLGVRRALVRVAAFPLSFATVGLGFVGILFGRERRALHDVLAGTAVVYDWEARTSRFWPIGSPRAPAGRPRP
jgi:uncharacterized RDD family membrane protein YckC